MTYGPFSLANTTAADLRFKLWTYSEMTMTESADLPRSMGPTIGATVYRETQEDGLIQF